MKRVFHRFCAQWRTCIRAAALLPLVIAAFLTALAADTASKPSVKHEFVQHPTEFEFVRLIYTASNNFGGRGERWLTDAPEAEEHLLTGVRRLTLIDANSESVHLAIMDDKLFDYPWLYAVEVGGWYLSEEEAARLRDYLLRGGFLVVDDFHGSYEWEGFVASMHRVFPDRPIVEIGRNDTVFHMLYDLDDPIQIPGLAALARGVTYEKDGVTPHWRGIYDDAGRLMVVINFNMDLGDAWELADAPQYPVPYTTRAYKYAINYILYAMTH